MEQPETSASYLRNPFDGPDLHPKLRWHCEPSRWTLLPAEHALRIEPDAGTDFWRKTHYGFEVDNGHFLHANVAGDFVLTAHVRFQPVHQYDQAGLMVRLSGTCWLKTSIEHEADGPATATRIGPPRGFRLGLVRSGCASVAKGTTTSSSPRGTARAGSRSAWPICKRICKGRASLVGSTPAARKAPASSRSSAT
jgi:hypothetical protein